jgi:hypothetical protein
VCSPRSHPRAPISIRGDSQADQRGNVARAGFPHDCGAMVLHRSLADAQIRGDVLAGMAGKHEAKNLPLTGRQAIEMGGSNSK